MPKLMKVSVNGKNREWSTVWWGTYMYVHEYSIEELLFNPETGEVTFKYGELVTLRDSDGKEVFTGVVNSFKLSEGYTLEIQSQSQPGNKVVISW